MAAGGVAVVKYLELSNGIHRSPIARPMASGSPLPPAPAEEQNILIMGLDSRVDQNGDPLPQGIYDAIRAGDQSDGGYNANVLLFVHIPAGDGKAVGISIPRDDYATLAGAPSGVERSKIKEAYGLALSEKLGELRDKGVPEREAYQRARAAARQVQLQTVSDFLGGVRIDHFVEITMAAFYEIAQAVQPITVCLNHDTQDRYSGAYFHAGRQRLNAGQAMAFVRQRRDTGPSDLELTDLDRTRRQQAFIVSLAYQLRQAETFTNLGTLQKLMDTAKQYIALDDRLDLLGFAGQARRLAGGNISFQTLPIERYERIEGKDVNIVDEERIHALVAELLGEGTPTGSPAPTAAVPSASPSTKPSKTPSSKTPSSRPSAPATPPTATYTDSATPLESGAIPCVN